MFGARFEGLTPLAIDCRPGRGEMGLSPIHERVKTFIDSERGYQGSSRLNIEDLQDRHFHISQSSGCQSTYLRSQTAFVDGADMEPQSGRILSEATFRRPDDYITWI